MTGKRAKYILFAVATAVIAALVLITFIKGARPYEPENSVASTDPLRSRQYVNGTGYKLDDNTKREQVKAEVKRDKIIEEKPATPKQKKLRARSGDPDAKGDDDDDNKGTKDKRRSGGSGGGNNGNQDKKEPGGDNNQREQKSRETRDADKKLPIITTDLRSNTSINGKVKKFSVSATSYDGEDIDASNIRVTFNDKILLRTGEKTYIGDVKKGTNIVRIRVVDSKGRENTRKYILTGYPNKKGKLLGTLKMLISAKKLGIPVVAPSKNVKIYENEQLSDVVKRYGSMLADVKIVNTGASISKSTYYIGRVEKNDIINKIPEDKVKELKEEDIDVPEDKNSLGSADFGPGSGWNYMVNGKYPSLYLNEIDPKVGSKVEIFYSY